ncbi:DEAD/DEAH box helicase [Caldithrix abyssi]|nr:DEAD/DEAH box helicase [Caldithrix abyssi]
MNHLSAQSVILSALFQEEQNSIAVICEDESIAKIIFNDCSNLLKDSVFLFPDLLDDSSGIAGFISQDRVSFTESFNALSTKTPGVYIASNNAVSHGTQTPEENIKLSLSFRVGSVVQREQVLEKLSLWGYEQVDHSSTPNTFSLRGGILDIFPLYSNHPVRIEFFGNQIESIRIFNPHTQLSEGNRSSFKLFPPIFKDKGSSTTLLDSINNYCGIVLSITNRYISFLGGGEVVDVFVEPIQLDGFSSEVHQKTIDKFFNPENPNSVYLFNPARRSFYRRAETKEISAALNEGFSLPSLGITCLVTLGGKKTSSFKKGPVFKKVQQEKISSLTDLNWGDYLVHQDYGIGIYRGLEVIGEKKMREENIRIEYAHSGAVYVPVNRFNRVHKYIGLGNSTPQLSRLGSASWEKQKALTKKSTEKVVEFLIALYQARSNPRGFRYTNDKEFIHNLEDSFPFQETDDQLSAIKNINEDLDKPIPMDRLVYGDVGFGKTEVAIRAAMRVVISGRTVFFLSPTTVLSDQHFITCKNRLAPLGVNVELLSRFRTKKEQSLIIEKLHKNKIDVLVGTHRLLSEDIPITNLGLLIVDEEHRFGVKHKETIRRLKKHVDILSLTATPIPRTLQQSLVGIRDTSKIETPPLERLPIKTYVKRFDWPFIKDVIQNELNRGGQVYFLHNDINSLPFFLEKVQGFFPGSNVAIGHGQLPSRELEKMILSFFGGEIDILLCTTIIESGLDVPNANTIIINNAQMFGLAQLYQIRGRVGRAEKQAFCYLCIPQGMKLLPDAYQRLKAIEYYSALGSGYHIAMKDLEIRGAGNLFGYEQSGQISRVGFELYNKILTQTLHEKKGDKPVLKKEKLTVVYSGSAQIEANYMPLVQDRLYFYQEISEANTIERLDEIHKELRDRFGLIPQEAENLFKIASIQCSLYQYPVSKCTINGSSSSFVLDNVPKEMPPEQFFDSLQKTLNTYPHPFRIETGKTGVLIISFKTQSIEDSFSLTQRFGELFSQIISG